MFNYNDIIEYIDGTYDENFNNARKWAHSHRATFNELLDRRKKIDGKLHRFYEIKEIIISEPDLEELKVQKRIEINRARDREEQSGFKYMGKTFDSDEVSCIRIMCAAQAMQVAPMSEDVQTITWTCKDNTTIDLTAQDLMGLLAALAKWSNKCHQRATELKAKINEVQSKEELEKIVWALE